MTQSNFNLDNPALLSVRSEETLNKFQTELVLTARKWAVDEIGAAMGHQLNEPLTALLLYLDGIRDMSGSPQDAAAISDPMRKMLESAIRETHRFSEIIQRMSLGIETKADAERGVARSREAIKSWSKYRNIDSPVSPNSGQHLLTPRERQVLKLITEGASNKEGGHRLQISTRTFEVHRAHIMGKLGARNAADLVRKALSEFM
jgi:DNA-binding CsgD family transcriptional regulator